MIKKKTSYINCQNKFFKALVIKKHIIEDILLIVETKNDIEEYKKIFWYINLNIKIIENYSDIIDLVLNKEKVIYLTSLNLINIKLDNIKQLEYKSLFIKQNEEIDIDKTIKTLNELGYKYSEYENPWTYKKIADTISITKKQKDTININLWWDIVENISKSSEKLEFVYIWENKSLDLISEKEEKSDIFDIIDENKIVILDDLEFNINYEELSKVFIKHSSFDYIWNKKLEIIDLESYDLNIKSLDEFNKTINRKDYKINIYTKSIKLIQDYLNYNNIETAHIRELNINNIKSFIDNKNKEIHISDDNISYVFLKRRLKKALSKEMDLLIQISPWDYVVHIEHGIWIFNQILQKELWWINKEYIEIEYLNNDKLFVPITEVSRVNKYIWKENPKLTPLNTWIWEKKIKKAKEEVDEISQELLVLYSQRKLWEWFSFKKYKEEELKFQNSFEYIYTDDQIISIEEIFTDMESSKAMDRLIIWDVGFWKTEIAFNAIYKAFLNKKQSILLSPLLVLAYEHFEKALERFNKFWLKIEVLTRLETNKKEKEIIEKLSKWEIDLIIWTHKLLNEKIKYTNLWLIIIDEEHKFWVGDKEKIKKYKNKIDILSMSATPIPRSLNMAMSKIRDMSILKKAPFGRQDISTQVAPYNEENIRDICQKEFDRWWQVFFINNKISNIENYKTILQKIFKDKKLVIAHWRLESTELEDRIIDFKNRKYDILISTSVIENGIDFPNVNTIIINNASNFWLNQLHQLRWRVGRRERKWYCYLLYNNESIKDNSVKKLKSIVEHSYLWAWFELALKDLEIRWWWELLWFKQSGESSQIWINLYLKLIEDKIEELIKKDDKIKKIEIYTKIDLNINVLISDLYFNNEIDKINFYKEIESINNIDELNAIIEDFKKIQANMSNETYNLFNIIKLRLYANKYNISQIRRLGQNYQIDFIWDDIENIKRFLKFDKDGIFDIVNIHILRTKKKNFENDEKFLKYLISILRNIWKTHYF